MTPTLPSAPLLLSDDPDPEPDPESPLSESSPHAVRDMANPSMPMTNKLCFRFTRTASLRFPRCLLLGETLRFVVRHNI
jgi:hypothetical protein